MKDIENINRDKDNVKDREKEKYNNNNNNSNNNNKEVENKVENDKNINTTMKYNFNMGYSLNKNYIEPEGNDLFEEENILEEKIEKDITKKQMLRNLSVENTPKKKRKNVNMGNYTYPFLTDEEILGVGDRKEDISRQKEKYNQIQNENRMNIENTNNIRENARESIRDTKKYEFHDRLNNTGNNNNNNNQVNPKYNDNNNYDEDNNFATRNFRNVGGFPIMDDNENIEYEVEGYDGRKQRKKTFNSQGNSILKLVIILIVIIAILLVPLIIYKGNLKAVDPKNPKEVTVQITEGTSGKAISKKLKEAGVIRSERAFNTYAKSSFPKFKAGKYVISTDKSAEDIVKMIVNGEVSKNIVKIQLIEGKTFKDLAKIISQKLDIPEDDVIKKGRDKEYLQKLISNYWFLTDSILDDNIYYPLEGYLFPDTYTFDKTNCTVEDVFKEMLKETEKKLKQYNDFKGTKKLGIHQVLTLASVVEKETLPKADRDLVATIFMNRLSKGMNLGSDVTTYYANNVKMGERDLKLSEISKKNPYNTRGPNMEGKLPIGPICMPSEESIIAAIDMATTYKPTKDLFFVSDKNGKIYATATNKEHENVIAELKKQGLWYEFK